MTADPGSLLPVAVQAITAASDLMRTRRPAALTEKTDRDLVSDVDLAIERAVRTQLQTATPGIGFLGEEEGGSGDTSGEWLWTLDPIDGTSNFAHGLPMCATSLALLHDGRPVLGVIDAPFLGQRYHTIEGHGAYAGTTRLAVSSTAELHDAVVAIGDYAVGDGADRKNQLRLATTLQLAPRVHRIRMIGTAALDLAWVAEGRLDASITLANNPWDTAAGALLAREAGATVVDKDGTRHGIGSTATIAAPPALVGQLVKLIQAIDSDYELPDPQTPPFAALDAILARTRHVILDFDGPVCDLFPGPNAAIAARQLRDILGLNAQLPAPAESTDPIDVLAQAVTADPALAERAEAAMTDMETHAVPTATPAAYVHEVIDACRESGRTVAVISRHASTAVHAYLVAHGLADQITCVTGRTRQFKPSVSLLEQTLTVLQAEPGECALVTASADGIHAAISAGTQTIGYATATGMSERLTTAGARTVIASLADLTLRLRARPLPN